MMQKIWFIIFIWFISSVFFLITAFCLISELGPDVTEQQSMAYMSGMMNAMSSSLMGLSMSIESDRSLNILIAEIYEITLPLFILGLAAGVIIKLRRRGSVDR